MLTVLSMWYNEEVLAPLFLQHYAHADRVHIILDADTSDSTESFLQGSRVTYELFKFPDMLDDILKAEKLNAVAREIDTDWLFVVDADEFIFPHKFECVQDVLGRQLGNVMLARMWQVYRHVTDSDLHYAVNPILQRRHGDPDRETRPNCTYCKPIIIHKPLEFKLSTGNHHISGKTVRFCSETFDGAHWAMADPSFAVTRRVRDRRLRQSKVNKAKGLTIQHNLITEDKIRHICKQHENNPQLF